MSTALALLFPFPHAIISSSMPSSHPLCHHLILLSILSSSVPSSWGRSPANSLFYYIPPCEKKKNKKLLARNLTTRNLFVALFFSALTILHCLGLLRSLGVSGFVHSFALVLSELSAWLLARTLSSLQAILFHFTPLCCQLQLALSMLWIWFLHFGFPKKGGKCLNMPPGGQNSRPVLRWLLNTERT